MRSASPARNSGAAQRALILHDGVREALLKSHRVMNVLQKPMLGLGSFLRSAKAVDVAAEGYAVELTHDDEGKVAMTKVYRASANPSLRKFDASSQPRCIACGRLQGLEHAAGCWVAILTIRRAH